MAGDLLGQRNLLDVIKDDAFQRELHGAMFGAAQADRPSYEKLLRGFATLGGVRWTPELQRQATAVSSQVAQIAPYVAKLTPSGWDAIHGSGGSAVSLTQAFAEANRDRLSPQQSGQIAEQLHGRLTAGDSKALRGFSTGDLGQLYKELRRQGRIGDNAQPDEIHKRLGDWVKPLSAVRDALGTTDIQQTLDAFRKIPAEQYANATMDEVEARLRSGDILGRQGGAFSMAAQAAGPLTGSDIATLTAKDKLLRQQAAASPMGNMVGATQQLSGSFTPGSPGAQLLAQMQSGQLSNMQPGQWLQAMQASGINPAIAQDTLRQTAANRQQMTPELIDTVRRNQGAIDLKPLVERNMAMLSSPPELREQLRPGVQEQVAAQAGYSDWNEANALHGAPAHGVCAACSITAVSKPRLPASSAASARRVPCGGWSTRLITSWKEVAGS